MSQYPSDRELLGRKAKKAAKEVAAKQAATTGAKDPDEEAAERDVIIPAKGAVDIGAGEGRHKLAKMIEKLREEKLKQEMEQAMNKVKEFREKGKD